MEKSWDKMTPAEKREQRFQWLLNPEGVKFASKEAEKNFQVRAKRLVDVYKVQQPDRVPVNVPVGYLPARRAGLTLYDVMNDPHKAVDAWKKFNDETDLDTFSTPGIMPYAKVMELMDYKLYRWPGHGIPQDVEGFQFVEGEYMNADEYDDLIRDPSDFWLRTYLPRVYGIWEPFRSMATLTNITENVHFNGLLMPFATPKGQETLKKIGQAAKALGEWNSIVGAYGRRGMELGFAGARGSFGKAPFDTIGDTLRGTKGIFFDMYRQPKKLLKALDVVADISIASIISTLNASKGLVVGFPLHKGADGWMSEQQFDTFYWPSLKKVIDAIVSEGGIASLFAEGAYDTRLEKCNVFPKGSLIWLFDKSDMAHAKKVLGKDCCISGNVPASLIHAGTPAEVKAYCRKLIETCAPGGGYILAAGNNDVEGAKLENLEAMVEAAREYGVYRKK